MKWKLGLCSLVFAHPLSAQLDSPSVAPEGLELVVAAEGRASVPAQGFRIQAVVPNDPDAAPSSALERAGVLAQIAALQAPNRTPCSFASRFGFIGNAPDPDQALLNLPPEPLAGGEGTVQAEQPSDGGWWGGGPLSFEQYDGQFATLADYQAAADGLASIGALITQSGGVLYDCLQAENFALMVAVDRANAQAQYMATSMGLRIASIRRIETGPDSAQNYLLLVAAQGFPEEPGAVTVSASVAVTYLLQDD